MQVSVEVTDGLQRRMTVGIPKERIEHEYQTRIQSLARKTKINGFRPGKVPMRLVQQRHGGQVRQEVIEEMVRHSLQEVMTQGNLRIAGMPELESIDDQGSNADLGYTVTFEVYPEMDAIKLEGVSVERPQVEITAADIEDMILSLRRQRQSWEVVGRAAQKDDRVRVDYHGTMDGEAFAGGSAENQEIVIGSGRYLDSFESALIGAQADTTVEFDSTFPADYHQDDLAGKTAHFSARIHSVEAPVLPEVDEAFARGFGIEEGGVDALRQEVTDNLSSERDKEIKNQVKKALFDRVADLNAIQVPRSLVKEEARRMAQNFQRELQAQGLRFTQALDAVKFERAAEPRVKMGLLLGELIRAQGFKPDPQKVRELLENLASTYEEPQAYINWHYAEPGRLADVEAAVLEDLVMDWMLERVQITDKPMSFKELMAARQKSA